MNIIFYDSITNEHFRINDAGPKLRFGSYILPLDGSRRPRRETSKRDNHRGGGGAGTHSTTPEEREIRKEKHSRVSLSI